MEVNVHHFLMCFRAIVLDDVVCARSGRFHESTGDSGKRAPDGRGGLVTKLVKKGLPLLGDHQKVSAAQRSHVEEGEDVFILVESVAGDLSPEDPGENGVFFI